MQRAKKFYPFVALLEHFQCNWKISRSCVWNNAIIISLSFIFTGIIFRIFSQNVAIIKFMFWSKIFILNCISIQFEFTSFIQMDQDKKRLFLKVLEKQICKSKFCPFFLIASNPRHSKVINSKKIFTLYLFQGVNN